MTVFSYVGMIVSLICGRIIGLELFGVLQLSFFALADDEFVHLYLQPLLAWRYMNGYNIQEQL